MTPEQYHLTEGPKIRDQLRKDAEALSGAVAKEQEANLRKYANRVGVRIPASAKWHENGTRLVIGDLRIELEWHCDKDVLPGKATKRRDALQHKRRMLCKHLTTAGSRQFAAWFRAKHGRKADPAIIPKAHAEWMEFISNCTC